MSTENRKLDFREGLKLHLNKGGKLTIVQKVNKCVLKIPRLTVTLSTTLHLTTLVVIEFRVGVI